MPDVIGRDYSTQDKPKEYLHLYLPVEQIEWLSKRAHDERTTKSGSIRSLIQKEMENHRETSV